MILLALLLAGCGSEPKCEQATEVLVGQGALALTCADLQTTEQYVELLAGRSIDEGDRRQLRRGLSKRYRQDPGQARAELVAVQADVQSLASRVGLAAAEQRSTLVYGDYIGQGAFGERDDRIAGVLDRAVAVWEVHEADRLALTEMDIEGWILYASLCREVQSGAPFRLSVADRVSIYADLEDRYRSANRHGRVALTAFGPFWAGISEAWSQASYEDQQRWIAAAPLPPPMVATSKGYLAAILDTDPLLHAVALHDTLGPIGLSAVP